MTEEKDTNLFLKEVENKFKPDVKILDRFKYILNNGTKEILAKNILHIEKPWGNLYLLEDINGVGISFLIIHPKGSTSMHYHNNKQEFFMVKKGALTIEFEDQEKGVWTERQYDFFTPRKPHKMINNTEEDIEVIEIIKPPNLDDLNRISDSYERKIGNVSIYDNEKV